MNRVRPALVPEEIPLVRALFGEYLAWLGEDLGFQGVDAELAGLPGKYAPPDGEILLAEIDGAVAGCVAFRKFSQGVCEMKRLWVRPTGRRRGIGGALVRAAEEHAVAAGYHRAVLDTLERMAPAVALYESLGYRRIPPYYDNPLPGALYLARELTDDPASRRAVHPNRG